MTTPASNGLFYNASTIPANIAGTAADSGAGVATVKISIQESGTNQYLNQLTSGAAFNQGSQTFLTATGTTSWTASTANIPFADGHTYTITVQTTDAVPTTPNVNNSAATRTLVYDTTAPTATVTTPASDGLAYKASNLPANIAGSAADATSGVATVKLSILESGTGKYLNQLTSGALFNQSSQTFLTATGTTSWTASTTNIPFADGHTYTITVQTADNATNTDSSAATRTLVYDTTAATATVTTPPSDGTAYNASNLPANIAGTSADTGGSGVATVKLSVRESGTGQYLNQLSSGAAFNQSSQTFLTASGTSSWTASTTNIPFADGRTYTITVQTIDNASNTDSSAATRTLVFDTTNPTGSITTPASNGIFYNASTIPANIAGTAADTGGSGVATVKISIQESGTNQYLNQLSSGAAFNQGSQTFLTATGTTSWTASTANIPFADGHTYTITLEAIDAASNTDNSAATRTLIYDTSAPTATVSSPSATQFRSALDAVTGTASDGSGTSVASVSIKIQKTGDANGYWTSGSSFGANSAGATAISAPNTGNGVRDLVGGHLRRHLRRRAVVHDRRLHNR